MVLYFVIIKKETKKCNSRNFYCNFTGLSVTLHTASPGPALDNFPFSLKTLLPAVDKSSGWSSWKLLTHSSIITTNSDMEENC